MIVEQKEKRERQAVSDLYVVMTDSKTPMPQCGIEPNTHAILSLIELLDGNNHIWPSGLDS